MISTKQFMLGTALSLATIVPATQAADIAAPSGAYAMDPTHASITWKVSHFGLSDYTARFTKFYVKLNLDVDHVENSTVSASIDPTSVRTDHPGGTFDSEISTDPKFLNATDFPKIEFVSKTVEKTGDNTALIHGEMTMLGVSKPITLVATLGGSLAAHPYAKVPAVGFHAEGTVKRSEFGFDHLVPYVGDEITFEIEAEFIKAD